MIIFKHTKDITEYLSKQKELGCSLGFIPTMGALHMGHISLIEQAKADCSLIICSIFINPTQFNDKKDFEKYPVSTAEDIEMLVKAGCDVLFLPSVEEIYPRGTNMTKSYDFGYLETILEGAHRPGHFHGVGQVVGRLLEIVNPGYLYLGQKDYQQCMVITRLVDMMGLNELKVIICPTVREADGLAMSSRNRRLTDTQRVRAGIIYQCLISIESKQGIADFSVVRKECEDLLEAKGFDVEYVALADAGKLELLNNYKKDTPMVALIAAKIGDIRLIDNLLVVGRK